MCRTGRYNLCPTRKGFGYGVNGAMASYVKAPARCLHAIPDTLPFEYACLCEPHAVAYQSMCVNSTIQSRRSRRRVRPGTDRVALHAHGGARRRQPARRRRPCRTTARGSRPRGRSARRTRSTCRRSRSRTSSASLDPLGADLVCEASGASRPLDAALQLVKPGGQVTKVGWSPDPFPIDMNPLVGKNVTLQGSFSHNYPVWERVIHLLDTGMAKPELVVGLKSGLPAVAARLRRHARRRGDQVGAGADAVRLRLRVQHAGSRVASERPQLFRVMAVLSTALRSSPDRRPASARASPSTSPRSARR